MTINYFGLITIDQYMEMSGRNSMSQKIHDQLQSKEIG